MLTHPTLDQLRALRLDGMADAFVELQSQDRARDLAPAEWLALMLDREATHRGTQRFKSRLRNAKLRHGQASIEDVDYRTPGGSTRHCSSNWPPVAGSPSIATCCHRPVRRRQVMAQLRAGTKSLP